MVRLRVLIGVICTLFLLHGVIVGSSMHHVHGKTSNNETGEPRVLVVYSSVNGEISEHERLLDMLISHFTTRITFKTAEEVEADDLIDTTHLVYYGRHEEILPDGFLTLLDSYAGTVLALGYNVEQLGSRFSFIELVSKGQINEIYLPADEQKRVTFVSNFIFHVEVGEGTEIMVEGGYADKRYPLFVKNGDTYYYASHELRPPKSIFVAEALHDVFDANHEPIHPAYIRLEDIHPLVEPDKLRQIGKILKERNIPYMLAVIPVYTNPETGKQYHFGDSPKLLKVLKEMQENGGSIVLHGYTHQFRMSETGEGFEFWDVEYNMPIYHQQDEEVVVKTREDFTSEDLYAAYLASQKAFEREYIQAKVTKGIQELANYGIYPLAFEAPHYTMSQHGYKVIAEHFSTYVGQLQLSDQDWEIMTTAPYITSPTFLDGMLLLPETLGYVHPEDPYAIDKMIERARQYQIVRDGMVAGFYHPYLGAERFIELMDELEKIPNLSWIDLKQLPNAVRAENVAIKSLAGEIVAQVDYGQLFSTSLDFLAHHALTVAGVISWGVAGIGFSAVVLFVVNIIVLRIRNNQVGRDQIG